MASSCPSSCSMSCISPCKQHCCQEHYPPNSSTQSPAICPSQCAIHCEDMWPAQCCPASLIPTIVIFNKIFNTNRKIMSSQTFCCHKGMQHLHVHHVPQFLLVVMFTQLAPVLLHGGTNITGWKVSWSSRNRLQVVSCTSCLRAGYYASQQERCLYVQLSTRSKNLQEVTGRTSSPA